MCGSLLRVRAVGCLSGAFSPLLMRSRGTSGLSCFPRAPTLTSARPLRDSALRSAVSTLVGRYMLPLIRLHTRSIRNNFTILHTASMQTSLGIAVTVIVDRDGETASAGVGGAGGKPHRRPDRTGWHETASAAAQPQSIIVAVRRHSTSTAYSANISSFLFRRLSACGSLSPST
jgi:hypothetical protein